MQTLLNPPTTWATQFFALVTGELNHSCTSQCPNPCPAASSALERPETETVSPVTA